VGDRESALEDLVSRSARPDPGFWRGRRVLLTGHTGFKGAWTALWLARLGAEVHGFALPAEGSESLWREFQSGLLAGETIGDVRDAGAVREAAAAARPEIVLHLAAQALVRRGYADPVSTIAVNALGTAQLLDALRGCGDVRAVIVVTTDKVYAEAASGAPYRETDALGGADPYSASKAAAELIARSFSASYLTPAGVALGTARAGNVIGGGDFAQDRLIPDLWRSVRAGAPLRLRHPTATRPWQHVLDPLRGYLLYAERLCGAGAPPALNFGPAAGDRLTVAALADAVAKALGASAGWEADGVRQLPEAQALSLDASLAAETLGWEPLLAAEEMVAWTARWYAAFAAGAPAMQLCEDQIAAYEATL
jgi:CDP-glucose 4,6-dehydratase